MNEELLRIIELFDDEVVTTADRIDRPQRALDRDAIDDFMKRNPIEKADGGRIPFNKGAAAERERRLNIAYDTYGKKNLDKGARVLGFKNFESMRGEENANLRRKIFKELKEFGEVMTEEGSRKRSRVGRIQTEQNIQIKLLDATNKNKFFDPKKFAKDNNISLPELKKQAALLQKNIYNKRMLTAGKEMRSTLTWIPDDPTVSDNALNKLWKSK